MPVQSIRALSQKRNTDQIADSLPGDSFAPIRKVAALLRDHRPGEAAKLARESGNMELATEIYSHLGGFKEISRIRVRAGDLRGGVEALMEAGSGSAALRLAWGKNDMLTVCEIAERTLESAGGNLDYSPVMVKILLKASEAAEMLLDDKSVGYVTAAREIAHKGIAHFKTVGDYYTAALLATKISDQDALISVVREGLAYQNRIGYYDRAFLGRAELAVGGREGYGLEDRTVLFTEICRQTDKAFAKSNGNGSHE